MLKIKYQKQIIFLIAGLLFLFNIGQAQDNVSETVLDNGLTVIIYEDHSVPLVAVNLSIKAGSRYEVSGYTGLSNICSEIFRVGTESFASGMYERMIRSAGGNIKTFSGIDYCFYSTTVPSRMLDTVLHYEADRLANSEITFEKLASARQIVVQARLREVENALYGKISQGIRSLSYQHHPYRFPRYGYPDDLAHCTIEDAEEFFDKFYTPANAVLVLAGDVNSKKVLFNIREKFENIPSSKMSIRKIAIEPTQESERRAYLPGMTDIGALIIAHHVPGMNSKDNYALKVMIELMAGGEASRVHRKLVTESGLSMAAGGFYFGVSDPSLFAIWSISNYDAGIDNNEKMLLDELYALKDVPVSEAELEKAKNRIEVNFYRGLRDIESTAIRLGIYHIAQGSWKEMYQDVQLTREVTAEQIMDLANKYFSRSNRNVFILEPPDLFEEAN